MYEDNLEWGQFTAAPQKRLVPQLYN